MNFAILERPSVEHEEQYRGLERYGPEPPEEDSPLMPLWIWYSVGPEDYIHDEQKAVEFINRYNKANKTYELVRIEKNLEARGSDQFLGVDVAAFGGHSLLKSGLLFWCHNLKPDLRRPLVDLVCRYFRPRLNHCLLFQQKEDADLFARVVRDIESVDKNYEYVEPGYDYFPQFLYSVDTTMRQTSLDG